MVRAQSFKSIIQLDVPHPITCQSEPLL
eukprot:COSAG06_NODE_47421_length_339_cov_0.858333_1_plen_27_part_10